MNKNIVVVLIGLLITVGVYAYTQQEASIPGMDEDSQEVVSGFKGMIGATDFSTKIASEEYIILDIRTSEEYAQQRIGNDALSVDFYAPDFEQQLDSLDKSKKYLVHCKIGGKSTKAVKLMEELGFEEFYELRGGINSWNRDELPTNSGEFEEIDTEPVSAAPAKIDPIELPKKGSPVEPVMCTMDAMQCPDGSYVGRTGSICEFVCPEVNEEEKKPLSTTEASSLDW